LVSGGFDVTALRSSEDLSESLEQDPNDRMIVVVDLDEPMIDVTLRNVMKNYPGLGIIARTDRGPIAAEAMLSMVDIDRSAIVPRTASEADLVDAAKRILSLL